VFFTLSCAVVACSDGATSGRSGGTGGSTSAGAGGTATSGGAGGAAGSGGQASGNAGAGGTIANGGSGGSAIPSTGGASIAGTGGFAGSGAGGTVASGSASGGKSGEADASIQNDAAADTGVAKDRDAAGDTSDASAATCPATLPALAADGDTSFYANKPNVPHGTIASVQYTSGSKTMHIYTPPDYATNTGASYPVLYLNHGVGEDDSVWGCTTGGPECGYSGLILDNLIADGKAVPMIMVMTDTRDCATLDPPTPPADDACTTHYRQVLMPYVETHYRVKADRNYRAIGGLSLGGIVTFNVGLTHLELFSQLFIYSSGFFTDARPTWETNMSSILKDPKTNHLLNVPIYMAAGDTDVALANAEACRDILKNDGIKYLWQQSTLGHEWANWRRYLAQTLPLMFRNMSGCD
jgi:enterochelin esterase-like enzyme